MMRPAALASVPLAILLLCPVLEQPGLLLLLGLGRPRLLIPTLEELQAGMHVLGHVVTVHGVGDLLPDVLRLALVRREALGGLVHVRAHRGCHLARHLLISALHIVAILLMLLVLLLSRLLKLDQLGNTLLAHVLEIMVIGSVQHGEGLAADRGPCMAAQRISAGHKHSRTDDSAGGLGEGDLPSAGRSLRLAATLGGDEAATLGGDELVRGGHCNRTTDTFLFETAASLRLE